MFLKPVSPEGSPPPPLSIERPGGSAGIAFLDGIPVLTARGDARFGVVRSRRWPLRPRTEEVPAGGPVSLPLGKGDVLRLAFAGEEAGAWTYDPDGNLSRPARWLVRIADEAAFVAFGLAVIALVVHAGLRNGEAFVDGASPGNPIPAIVGRNVRSVYPRADERPSEYLKVLGKAWKENADVESASKAWIDANPVSETQEPNP